MTKLIAVAATATLALVACSSGDPDVSPETLTEALVEQGLEEPIASCISTELASQLDDETFNQVALAETPDEIPADAQDLLFSVTADCVIADG